MRPQFPGMDPWLESPELWPDVHNSLITAIHEDIDLLRDGEPPPLAPSGPVDDHRIMICRTRPGGKAVLHLMLNPIVHDLYDRASYDLVIDDSPPPPKPPLREADSAREAAIIAEGRPSGPAPAFVEPGPQPATQTEATP